MRGRTGGNGRGEAETGVGGETGITKGGGMIRLAIHQCW